MLLFRGELKYMLMPYPKLLQWGQILSEKGGHCSHPFQMMCKMLCFAIIGWIYDQASDFYLIKTMGGGGAWYTLPIEILPNCNDVVSSTLIGHLNHVNPLMFSLWLFMVCSPTMEERSHLSWASHIKAKVSQITDHRFQPRQIVCDFEFSLQSAIATKLPHTRIAGAAIGSG